jgi:UDP-2,3-diacylglucosamine pyrophosphatase LpxH
VHAFIADIHLRPDAGKDAHRFISWISSVRAHAKAVYILGDLFDYWYTGLENRFQEVLDALNSPTIHLLTGNRDFLLRNTQLSDLQILPAEEIRIQVGNARLLLAHGHTLTQADLGFRLLHSFGWPALKVLDRVLPLDLKHHLAHFLVKSSATIRPSSLTIREGIEADKGVETVICGHLHRYIERPGLIVLPAFFDSGQWLSWDDSGPRLKTFP